MRLRELRDVYLNQDIYIVGTGPSVNLFPHDFLEDKICIGLNDAYKIHPAVSPVAFMHHASYSRVGDKYDAPFHPHFKYIKYPIVKASGKIRLKDEEIDWDNPHFYFYDWSHEIGSIWTLTKDTDRLLYTPEGCSLHAALQVAWILGARNIFVLGCDSRTLGGKHYAQYNKDGYRDTEVLARGAQRNYDSYVYGTLIIQNFLKLKGINVINLSPMVGYHLVDFQFDVLTGKVGLETVLESVSTIGTTSTSGATQ